MKGQLFGIILISAMFQSCEIKTEREIEIDRIENNSMKILARIQSEMNPSEMNNTVVWKTNLDSVHKEWQKIHEDSAELGLIYLQKFDSLYIRKSIELIGILQKEREKNALDSEKKINVN